VLAAGAIALVVVSNPQKNGGSACAARTRIATLSDIDQGEVRLTPVRATPAQLRKLVQPGGDTVGRRAFPAETTTYEIQARVLAIRRDPSDDIELAVSAPRARAETMTVTFPSLRCGHKTGKRKREEIRSARSTLLAECGNPQRGSTGLTGTAEISGVGFFGSGRGPYAPPNGFKLDPVLRFSSRDCRGNSSRSRDRAPSPLPRPRFERATG
jgi:hypothetical protein